MTSARITPLRARQDYLGKLVSAREAAAVGKPQLIVMSGPRRVGKTFLLQHLHALAEPASSLYFEATQAGETAQLRRFGDALAQTVGEENLPPGPTFVSWEHALGYCAFLARSRPLTVMLDEATYLMSSTPGFASVVQVVWDQLASRGERSYLMLVLTGSAVGLVEDALGHGGALYQRPTLRLSVEPLTAAEAYSFAGKPDPASLFEAYAACGGYPLHLDAWDFDRPAPENLLRLAGTPGGVLLEDANVFMAGLPEAHQRVLIAVGQGRTRRGEIMNEAGGRVDRSLEALARAGFLRAVTPLGAPLKARAEYRVVDAHLRFWFRVLANHVQRIEAGQGEAVLRHTEGEWQNQLGTVFEQAARHHAIELVRQEVLPAGTLIDEWWSTTGEQHQADVLGMLSHQSVAIGEAKWQRQPLGRAELEQLRRLERVVPDPVLEPKLLLWGRAGVRPELKTGRVRGYDARDMLELSI